MQPAARDRPSTKALTFLYVALFLLGIFWFNEFLVGVSIRSMKSVYALSLSLFLMAFTSCGGTHRHFVYTVGQAAEGIFGFEEATSGALTSIAGSPFSTGGRPTAIAVTPSRTFAYVLSAGGNAIASYNFDKSKGGLTAANPAVATGVNPVAIAIDPSSQHLYALNQGSSSISAYAIDGTSGVLTPLSGSPFATVTNPVSFALTAKGDIFYVVSPTQGLEILTVHSDGTLAVAQGAVAAGVSPAFVTVDPADHFVYVADSGGNSVVGFTVSGSNVTPISASVSTGTTPSAVAVDPQSKFLFVANQGSNNVSVFSIGSSGALAQVQGSPFTAGTGPIFVTVDQAGGHLFVADQGSSDIAEFSIAGNGSLSPVSGSPISVQTTPTWIAATN